jgi:hypothetical protein
LARITSLGVLIVLLISLTSNSIFSYSESSVTPTGELERHAPILGNTTISIEELERILSSLNQTSSDPRLNQILEDMNNSLKNGNYEEYEKAREELNIYLQNLSSQQENIPLDQDTIEKLALLASTFLNETNGYVDMAKFAQTLSQLAGNESNNPSEYEAGLNQLINRTSSREGVGGETNPPKIPQVPTVAVNPNVRVTLGIGLLSILKYSFLIALLGGILYLMYRYKDVIGIKMSVLTGRIVNHFKYRTYSPGNPKEAILYCFQRLVSILSWLGYSMNPWETPREYLSRVSLGPVTGNQDVVVELVEKAKYSPREPTLEEAEKCCSILRRVEESEL